VSEFHRVRDAAVAGIFYEAGKRQLQRQVEALLRGAHPVTGPPPKALIVPHAGYVYSGPTAAAAYRRLQPYRDSIERVALFGPAHRVYLPGMAVPSVDSFATPLGEVPVDRAAVERIAELPSACLSDEAHREEHCLEVQLPFLQSVLGPFMLVPVVVGRCAPGAVAAAMELLWDDPATLLMVSTDLSHYYRYEQALRIDALTCDRILARDSTIGGEEACGAHALNGLMSTALRRGLQVELLDMCNSGDTAGDREQVVGYGSFILH
jgi:AmmeMemoRadiSam system protein B